MAWYRWDQSHIADDVVSTPIEGNIYGQVFINDWPRSPSPSYPMEYATDYTISNGRIVLTNPETVAGVDNEWRSENTGYFSIDNTIGAGADYPKVYVVGTAQYKSEDATDNTSSIVFRAAQQGATFYTLTVTRTKGTFIQYVYSTNPGAYPEDGISGEYWYSGRTEVLPTAPGGITVPTAVAGEACAIAWTAAAAGHGSIASYILERSVNGSGWTQIYSGSALTYTDTIGEDWATVAYRVKAVDDGGGSGPYAASETQVVNAGILYISGPVSDMGEKTAPFAFTVSTGVSGQSGAVSVSLRLSLDGETLYSGTVSTGQDVSVTIDTRTMGEGGHTIAAIAGAAGYVGARASYAFSTPGFSLPTGGLGVQLQDNQGRAVFPQGIASLVAGINGRSVAGNLYDLSRRTRVNTNLLINWYFADPINQRGQTSYSGAGAYCIDGWYRGYTADAVLTLEDGYVKMTGAADAEFMQRLEDLYLGETLTASVLLQDGTLAAATGTLPSAYSGGYLDAGIGQSIPNTGGAYLGLSYYDNRLRFNFVCPSGSSLKPVAAKLELGDHQTLAYQDDEGNWRLYEIPDYAEELAKCQRYFYHYASPIYLTNHSSAQWYANFVFPVEMRIIPTITINNFNPGWGTPEAMYPSIQGVTFHSASSGAIILEFSASAEL